MKSIHVAGYWEKESTPPPVDERMSLEGWTLHWLGPMTTASAQGTTLEYGAKAALSVGRTSRLFEGGLPGNQRGEPAAACLSMRRIQGVLRH